MTYTPEQIAVLQAGRTPGKWRVTYRAPDYGFDIDTDAEFNLKGDRCMMFSSEGTAAFIAAAPAIVDQQAERIKELEAERDTTNAALTVLCDKYSELCSETNQWLLANPTTDSMFSFWNGRKNGFIFLEDEIGRVQKALDG